MMKGDQDTKNIILTLAILIIIVLLGFNSGILGSAPSSSGGNSNNRDSGSSDVIGDNKTGIEILGVRKNDAIMGSGPFLLIEYSDYECPFCQRFHKVVQQLVDSGEVTWVYRHLPLPFHETAERGSRIGECVRSIKGNNAFWTYTDGVFAVETPSLSLYRSLGQQAGLSSAQIDGCLGPDSDAAALVASHVNEAGLFGINGTPGSFVVNTKTGEYKRVPGAFPLDGPEGDQNTMRYILNSIR